MAKAFWIAGYDDYFTAADWTSGTIPNTGDLAIINQGSPVVSRDTAFSGITFDVGTPNDSPGNHAVFEFLDSNDTIAGDSSINTGPFIGDDIYSFYVGNVDITSGSLTNNGLIQAEGYQPQLNVNLLFGTLINNNVVQANGSHATVDITRAVPNKYALVVNDGMIQAYGGSVDIQVPVTGYGQMSINAGGHLTIESSLGDGQHINLVSGMLEITNPARMSFLGSVQGLTAASTMQIDGGWSDNGTHHLTLSDVSQGGETLNLKDGGRTVFSVELAGNYALADFHLARHGTSALIGYDHSPAVSTHPIG